MCARGKRKKEPSSPAAAKAQGSHPALAPDSAASGKLGFLMLLLGRMWLFLTSRSYS